MSWTVPLEWDGERADRVLANLSGRSRADVRAAIESGSVVVDGAAVEPRTKVAHGSEFTGDIPDRNKPMQPETVPFVVVYEDEDVAVIDKPAGVVTHPGAGNREGTLAAGLLDRWPRIRGVGADERWGIVHRLDRDTSGLLLVGLSPAGYEGLSEAIRSRAVTREYLALVAGAPATATGTIEAPIGRDPRRPTRMRIDPDGRRAVTHYRVEAAGDHVTLLRVTLETGRTHQIRVHLASIDLPVIGDRTYGRAAGSPRVFLHAARLSLVHPISGEPLEAEAGLPGDLADVLAGLGLG
jgi:23S rRNA pseudouridine1911/1915/1917 synthase